ncbi:MAG: hypothetical protein WCI73_20910 [Phycisphaerae bacterium]
MLHSADHPKIAKRGRWLLAAAAAVVGASSLANSAKAATYMWMGSAGANWGTSTNWSPAGASWSGGNVAQLGGGTANSATTVYLDSFTGDANSSITSTGNNYLRFGAGRLAEPSLTVRSVPKGQLKM